MIELVDVSFSYTPGGALLFQDFAWKAGRGESWAVLGSSGCGKSTLLYLLAGLRLPTRGQVRIDGQPLTRPRPHTGLILQDYGLLPWATVVQNAALGLKMRDFYGPDGKHAPLSPRAGLSVDYWLERLGLFAVREKYPSQISGGQRQRAAIARTLVLQPDLLLMDEPFSSLDAPTREGLQNLALELWAEQGLTMVTVTHAIEEAALLGQKILVLGRPPTSQATIIENPNAARPNFRGTPEYLDCCQRLRLRLEAA